MSRLFWMLLAAARGGYRYLRSLLGFSPGIRAETDTAPGSDIGAHLQGGAAELQNRATARPVANGLLHVHAGGGSLLANMVAWLVSLARFTGRAGETALNTAPAASPGAGACGRIRTDTGLTDKMEACPGAAGGLRGIREDTLTSGAAMAPPADVGGTWRASAVFAAVTAAGQPEGGTGALTAGDRLIAAMGSAAPQTALAAVRPGPALTARMMTWTTPEADGTVLYIRQVYDTEWDGTTLILY